MKVNDENERLFATFISTNVTRCTFLFVFSIPLLLSFFVRFLLFVGVGKLRAGGM